MKSFPRLSPRRLLLSLQGAALGAGLGVVDFALHAERGAAFSVRSRVLACALLALAYAVPLGLAGWLVARRPLLVWLAVVPFAAGQLVLSAYRHGLGEDVLLSTVALAAMVGLVGLLAALAVPRLGSPHAGAAVRIPAAVCAAVLVAAGGAFVWPEPRRAQEGTFPPPLPTGAVSARPNLIFITLDTVRPDHLPAYGYAGIRTPVLDRVAREGVVFEDAVSQAPITPVSHASLLTGLNPAAHGLRNFDRQNRLRAGVPTLAQILSGEGYRTGAVVAASTLDPSFGLDRGFDVYRLVLPASRYAFRAAGRSLMATALAQVGWVPRRGTYREAAPQVDDALAWVDRHRSTAFFLWLHLFDAHEPYQPPPFATRREHHPGPASVSHRVFLYDSEIVGMDAALGRLFARLDLLGLSGRTLVVVASDHGDGLGDHGYYGHTGRLFREQTRMVLFLRWPGHLPAGARVAAQVRSIDVLPTVLALLGARCPPVEGTDLRAWIARPAPDLPAYSETLQPDLRAQQLAAYDDGRYKLIRALGGRTWLFDRLGDPGEEHALPAGGGHPRLAAGLDAHLGGSFTARGDAETIPDDLRERLGSLGYLD
ncbi:MAG TPA: sulfatase [Candidatus Polarisedimenticolaceae bacterium]|nr:sulfatase [Candidatus Polarisedimenticolaceae bacterium]